MNIKQTQIYSTSMIFSILLFTTVPMISADSDIEQMIRDPYSDETLAFVDNQRGNHPISINKATFPIAINFLSKEGVFGPQYVDHTLTSDQVPDWVITTAVWWWESNVDSRTFLNQIQYLINAGIL